MEFKFTLEEKAKLLRIVRDNLKEHSEPGRVYVDREDVRVHYKD